MYLFLWLITFTILLTHSTGKDDNSTCFRTLPALGTALSEPPFFIPNNCANLQAFHTEDAENCLKNRTVYVIGNSIPRQYLVDILELLEGEMIGDKQACPKHQVNWDGQCRQEYKDVKFKFLFLRFMDGFYYKDRGGFPFLKNHQPSAEEELPDSPNDTTPPSYHMTTDSCLNVHTKRCLDHFFAHPKEGDIVIFSLGFAYCEQESELIDYEGWLRASAIAFRDNLLTTFPGTIYHVTNPEVQHYKSYTNFSQCLERTNEILWDVWRPQNHTFPDQQRWYHIDQYAINHDRLNLYNDPLHFHGPLSLATNQLILNALCPGHGRTIILPKLQYANKIVHVMFTSNKPTISFLVTPFGYFRRLPDAAQDFCRTVILHSGEITIDESEFSEVVHLGLPFNICARHTLLRTSGRTVYGVFEVGTRMFNSGKTFLEMGFDFEKVQGVKEEDFNLLKKGPPI